MIQISTTIAYQMTNNSEKYLKAVIPPDIPKSYLPFLKKYLGNEQAEQYILNQQKRDNYTHHMTIVEPSAFGKLTCSLNMYIDYPLLIQVFGIGHIKEEDNETCFLVCRCHQANRLRESVGLETIDMHITLGFKNHDIFNHPKDISTLIEPFRNLETTT